MLTFTSGEKVLTQLKAQLGSYADAGLIDDNLCYTYLVDAIAELGLAACADLEATVTITNQHGILPKYLKKLDEVWLLPEKEKDQPIPLYPAYYPHQPKKPYPVYNYPHPFQVSPAHKHYHKPHFYELKGNVIAIPIDKGTISIKYQGLGVTIDNIPMIPDDPLLIKYFIAYVKYRVFQNLYYDGVVNDIQQRYQDAKQDAVSEELRAKSYVKLSSFESLLRMKLDGKFNNLSFWK